MFFFLLNWYVAIKFRKKSFFEANLKSVEEEYIFSVALKNSIKCREIKVRKYFT